MPRIWALLLALALVATNAYAKSKEPSVEETKFKSIPWNLFFFEDSDVALVTDVKAGTVYRSEDAGVVWKKLKDVKEGEVLGVMKHPYDNEVAVVLGTKRIHWVTKDQGKSWRKWTSEKHPRTDHRAPALSFHASDPNRIILLTAECGNIHCEETAYYTDDMFESDPKELVKDTSMCLWAKTTDIFATGDEQSDKNRILCIVKSGLNPFMQDHRLVSSDDFFDTHSEPALRANRPVSGILNIAAVKHYLVAAARSKHTTELAMYVTDDAATWHQAELGEHKLEENAYTLLESTNYSMQVDVLTAHPMDPMGVLLTSNSNGTFFSKNVEHTNRDMRGFVDFEKIQNIQGIILVNTVDNWEDVQKGGAKKEVISRISFNDGRDFHDLKVGDDKLHLHSVTEQRNEGRLFSSPAPGIVMGVGNTGKHLKPWSECDLYISDDAGLTWRRARTKPHFYEFGDQGAIVVAIEDGETEKIYWSINHGKDWDEMDIGDKITPKVLTTVPDSTSLKFILIAAKAKGSESEFSTYSFDFKDVHGGKCGSKDFEKWHARVDKDGNPTCIMGHTQTFRRRKADAKCSVSEEFKDPVAEVEHCECTGEDYECDYENGFVDEDGKCVPSGRIVPPSGKCEDGKGKFMGSSGWRLIPGNTCVNGVKKDKQVEYDCDVAKKPVSGKIAAEITPFKGDKFIEYHYLERTGSSHGSDETVVLRTDRNEVYLSRDHGKKWAQIIKDEEVVAIYPHRYLNDNVYFITPSKKVYYSKNRGQNIHAFDAPAIPNQDYLQILSFHPTNPSWLIWTGGRECKKGLCRQTIAHVSTKDGEDWETLLTGVRKCQFVYREDRAGSDKLVYCEQYEKEDTSNSINLLSSDDWFQHRKELRRDVINFATMAEYIVVAVRDPDQQTLQASTSIDGQVFADAKFPPNFRVEHQQAYTVLDSSTHAVFLHVTVNNKEGKEYGTIVKSNSNGTSYVLSVSEVNRNGRGYVDFEKMLGLEGVAIINRVANAEEANEGSTKKLKTYITHNDGADWSLIPVPIEPPIGKTFECDGKSDTCNLHLHGYTERKDPRDTFSSPSAIGVMMATGNVGEFLGHKKEADTFITRDGGISWTVAAPGNWMWEYGDQGSIIVIVKENEPTSEVLYTLDEGLSWTKYEFSNDGDMEVDDITTVPSDTSMNFLLWGRVRGDLVTVNLDFSGLKERETQCVLDDEDTNSEKSDYNLWSPRHPSSDDDCLFGHVAQYHRKKLGHECYNGGVESIQHLHKVLQNCTCERRDFECDYNYERQADGSCKLIEGLKPADPKAVCDDPDVEEYWAITGYRRIPLTTCQGGKEMEHTSRSYPCPGKEKDWNKKHGISGLGLFFAIVLPIAAAAGVGYWVWKNWDSRFGRIQLGGGDGLGGFSSSGGRGAFDRDAPWVKYPVMALSGIVAVAAAIPMVVGSLWNIVSTRLGRTRAVGGSYSSAPYTSRGSLRSDYAVVNPDDEGELLGDDSDEDV